MAVNLCKAYGRVQLPHSPFGSVVYGQHTSLMSLRVVGSIPPTAISYKESFTNRQVYIVVNPPHPMKDKIISKVTESKNKQRRVTIPKEEKTLKKGDYVEVKKVKIK